MKRLLFVSCLAIALLFGCSSEEENTNPFEIPTKQDLLPTQPNENQTLPTQHLVVQFDTNDIQWYNTTTGELKFTTQYTMKELAKKGYITINGHTETGGRTFAYANQFFSQIIDTPVLYNVELENGESNYYITTGYPFWLSLTKEQKTYRQQNIDAILPSWIDFLDKLNKEKKLVSK